MNKLLDAIATTAAAASIATVNVQAIISIIAGVVAIVSGIASIVIKLILYKRNDNKIDDEELKDILKDLENLKNNKN